MIFGPLPDTVESGCGGGGGGDTDAQPALGHAAASTTTYL
jgi:hypothetical protein